MMRQRGLLSQTIACWKTCHQIQFLGELAATDIDATDNHTFELITGSGDEDNDLFSIKDDQILTALPLRF